jgi:hypothetical protein
MEQIAVTAVYLKALYGVQTARRPEGDGHEIRNPVHRQERTREDPAQDGPAECRRYPGADCARQCV